LRAQDQVQCRSDGSDRITSCAGIGRRPEHRTAPPASLCFTLVLYRGVRRMTEPNYAEFDELHRTWLTRQDIEICELICLAHGSPPGTFGRITDPDAQPHFRSLKALIKRKLLPHHSDGSQADRFTVITLEDLLKCLKLDKVASDPSYDWLRKFADRWSRYCVLPAIKVDGAGKPKPRATYDIEEITRRYRSERAGLASPLCSGGQRMVRDRVSRSAALNLAGQDQS
jgi:hypothetical protein